MPESAISSGSAVMLDRLYRFHGGLKLAGHQDMTEAIPIKAAGVPPLLVLPLLQHIGEPAECLVKTGDYVYKGQPVARPVGTVSAPVHASSSGTVIAVESRPIPHPSGLQSMCVIIETDGKDQWPQSNHAGPDYTSMDPATLCTHIRQAGIVGLGGAGFPTPVKLAGAGNNIDLLLINGAECEPYISCDSRLLQERADEVIDGTRILQHIVRANSCIIAIENHMSGAGQALQAVLDERNETGIRIVAVPDIYPAGGERQLIKVLTNREVPSQRLPVDVGIICQNVGTAAAIYDSLVRNQPLLSRIVTVTGCGITSPGNIESLIGTPVSHLVKTCGGYTSNVERLLIGGPMMGYAVTTDNIPVIKTTNCILAVTHEEMPPPPAELACIRCGKCTEVCPADLLPQQLYWYARSGNYDAAQDYDLFDCIECGCCAYVCPSHIPLVQYYRHAKTEIWSLEKQKKASDIARQRHEARQARLERIKQERAERQTRKKQALSKDAGKDAKKAAIEAALERVKQKKAQASVAPKNIDNLSPGQQELIDDADKRRQERTAD